MCQAGKLFEQEVMAAAKFMGHEIERPPQPGADGGIDIITQMGKIPLGFGRYVIQCKDTPKGVVGRDVVDQLVGTLERENVPMGIIVTTGQFSKKAVRAAKDSGRIQLIDGYEWKGIRSRLTELLHVTLAFNGATAHGAFVKD